MLDLITLLYLSLPLSIENTIVSLNVFNEIYLFCTFAQDAELFIRFNDILF